MNSDRGGFIAQEFVPPTLLTSTQWVGRAAGPFLAFLRTSRRDSSEYRPICSLPCRDDDGTEDRRTVQAQAAASTTGQDVSWGARATGWYTPRTWLLLDHLVGALDEG